MSGLIAFLQVCRASDRKVSKRLQRSLCTSFLRGRVIRESKNEQSAAEGLRVTVSMSGLLHF